MTNIRITFDRDLTAGLEDGIVARVDSIFPVVVTDMAVGSLTIDATEDPSEYSAFVAASEAVSDFGLNPKTAIIDTVFVE